MNTTIHRKPPKPYPTYPLFAHTRGYWAKTIDKKHVSFGRWAWPHLGDYEASWKAAVKAHDAYLKDVAHGRVLEEHPDRVSVELLVNAYLTHQHQRLERGDIRPAHYQDVLTAVKLFRDTVGRRNTIGELEQAGGVALIKAWIDALRVRFGSCAYNRHVTINRAMFKWAEHPVDGLLGRPFRLMPLLVKQGDLSRRREVKDRVVERGEQCFTAAELLVMIHAGGVHHAAMALLGYFCGFGNTDCAQLTHEHVDLAPDPAMELPPGWGHIHFPRPKTEIARGAVIPPLVCDALRASMALRPKPKQARWAKNVFITLQGLPFTRRKLHRDANGVVQKVTCIDSIGLMHGKARKRVGICPTHGAMLALPHLEGKCPHCATALRKARPLGFYTYRHTALTFGSGTTTPDALHLWEGHAIPGVRKRYVAHVETRALKPIADALLERLRRAVVAATTFAVGSGAASDARNPFERHADGTSAKCSISTQQSFTSSSPSARSHARD